MRCKFCGLETKTSICEYCGYDNVHGDGYETEAVTGRNYHEPALNKTNYGGETTAEHAAHAAYEEPELYYGDVVDNSSFRDPDRADYNYGRSTTSSYDTYTSNHSTRVNTTKDSENSFGLEFHWFLFIMLMIWSSPLAFIYLFLTIFFPKKKK